MCVCVCVCVCVFGGDDGVQDVKKNKGWYCRQCLLKLSWNLGLKRFQGINKINSETTYIDPSWDVFHILEHNEYKENIMKREKRITEKELESYCYFNSII